MTNCSSHVRLQANFQTQNFSVCLFFFFYGQQNSNNKLTICWRREKEPNMIHFSNICDGSCRWRAFIKRISHRTFYKRNPKLKIAKSPGSNIERDVIDEVQWHIKKLRYFCLLPELFGMFINWQWTAYEIWRLYDKS